MKKLFVLLSLVLCLSLTACGTNDKAADDMRRISLAFATMGDEDITENLEGYIEIGPIADEIDFNFVIDAGNGFKLNFKGRAYNPKKSEDATFDSTYYDVDLIKAYNENDPSDAQAYVEKLGELVFYNEDTLAYGLYYDGELLFLGFTDDDIEK